MSKLVTVLVGVGLLLAGASGAEARAGDGQALDWRDCDPGFQCATARVRATTPARTGRSSSLP